MPVVPSPGISGFVARRVPGGSTGYEVQAPAAGYELACPSGYHPNKSDYFLRDGTFVAKGSRCVKNRRRNPFNPRAADRAYSRMKSAKRAADKIEKFFGARTNRQTLRAKKR